MKPWVDALGVLASCSAIGVFFDAAYLTEQHRDRLHRLITREGVDQKTYSDTFLDYVRAINAAIFDRFFSAPFLSLRYFISCMSLSIAALLIALTIQLYFYGPGDLRRLEWTNSQLAVLTFCILSNIIIDWLSIGQTHVFFLIASEQERPFRVLLLMVSDLYVTLNLFMAAYALAVTVILIFCQSGGAVHLQANVEVADLSEKEARTLTEVFSDVSKLKTMTFNIIEQDDGRISQVSQVQITTDNVALSLKDTVEALLAPALIAAFDAETKVEVMRGDKTERLDIVRGTDDWNALRPEVTEETDTVSVRGRPYEFMDWSFDNLVFFYSAPFRTIAEVQLGFPQAVIAAPTFIPLSDLEQVRLQFVDTARPELFLCKSDAGWQRLERNAVAHSDCKSKFLAVNANIPRLQSAIDGRMGSKLRVPLNSLFLTSFSMTGLLYGLLLLLIVARLLRRLLGRSLAPIQSTFLRSPFGWSGLVVGSVLAVFVMVAG